MSTAESPATETARRVDELYRHHARAVYRYAYAVLGNRADAEDVTQTTFVNALRALERGERPRKPENWLLVIAHNLVRQRWRHAASRPAEVELSGDVAAAGPDHDDIRLDDLVHALQRIPPSQREALVMRELEGRPYAEIAELLGTTTGALETLLFRARRSLADELENLVTCERVELDLTRKLDGRLGRKERRRLDEHLAACPDCARRASTYARQRRAFTGFAVLPIPIGTTLGHAAPAASAAGLATIGSAPLVAAGGGALGTAGGATGAGLFAGAAAKVAAVVVAGTVATGAGVTGVELARKDAPKVAPGRSAPVSIARGRATTQASTATAKRAAAASTKRVGVRDERRGPGDADRSPRGTPSAKPVRATQTPTAAKATRTAEERAGQTPRTRPVEQPAKRHADTPQPSLAPETGGSSRVSTGAATGAWAESPTGGGKPKARRAGAGRSGVGHR